MALGNNLPEPDKVPGLLTCQASRGDPRPHVSIPSNNPHGELSKKKGSVGFSHIQTSQKKGSSNLGRNEARVTHLGAKILNKTWRRKGAKLFKMKEGSPQDKLLLDVEN